MLDRHVQIRTAGSFDFLSLYSRWKQCGSAGVCILHMLAFIVLWTLFVFEFGTLGILYISRQEVGGGGSRLGDFFTYSLAPSNVNEMQ